MVENVLVTPVLGGATEPWERMEKAIEHMRAATVYMVRMVEEKDPSPEAAEHAIEQLEEKSQAIPYFEYDVYETDLARFDEALSVLIGIVEKERSEEDPSKITMHVDGAGAMGAVTTTIAWLLEGVDGLYVSHPEFGDLGVQELPNWLEMDGPIADHDLHVLSVILEHQRSHDQGIDKQTLIERLQEEGLIREGQENAYRRLSQYFLPRLKEHGFVTDAKQDPWDRRKRLVEATQEGERAYEVLRPKLDEPEEVIHIGARAEAEEQRTSQL